MNRALLLICAVAVCSGCDVIYMTVQPVDLTVRSVSTHQALPNAEIRLAKVEQPLGMKFPTTQAWIDHESRDDEQHRWDTAVISDGSGKVPFRINTSIIVGGWFNFRQPLDDRVTGSDYWIRVRTAESSEILRLHMIPGNTVRGEAFEVELNTIGKTKEFKPVGEKD